MARGLPAHRLAATSITRFELLAGAGSAAERDRIRALLEPMAILPFDDDAADHAAEAAREQRAAGRPLPMADLAIAGICLSLEVPLLTRNRRHFERVPGLGIEGFPEGGAG